MIWKLGRVHVDAYTYCRLLSGSPRPVYIALRDGDLIELTVSLRPEQAMDFLRQRSVSVEKTLAPPYDADAGPAVRVRFNLHPPRTGRARYADGENTYDISKTRVRVDAWQAGARHALEDSRKRIGRGEAGHAAQSLYRFYEQSLKAFLEAWGILPWLMIDDSSCKRFAVKAYLPAGMQEGMLGIERVSQLAHPSHLPADDPAIDALRADLQQAESLAAAIADNIRGAEKKGACFIMGRGPHA